jgi:elongation factor Ts
MAVDMELLKRLRAITQAPLGECKQALEESQGDLDQAQQILRDKWALKASKKADRETNEWVVVIKHIWERTLGIKLACETDFVAKNETFIGLAHSLLTLVADATSSLFSSYWDLSDDVKALLEDTIKSHFVTIGENMQIIDLFAHNGHAQIYTHPGDKIAVAVFFTWDEKLAKDAALQVAAMNPWYHSVANVPVEVVDAEKTRFMQELVDDKKPEEIKQNIVNGKLAKFYSEIVFEEQYCIKDDSKKWKII